MQNKVRVHITEVKVNAPTYTNVTFNPSMINFFYGKNGTGKSTLAKAFKDGNADLTWNGALYPEERILVYNEDFISKNVQSYGNIPGVFTISEVNAEKKKLADDKTVEKKRLIPRQMLLIPPLTRLLSITRKLKMRTSKQSGTKQRL